jgi:hypothetical protein
LPVYYSTVRREDVEIVRHHLAGGGTKLYDVRDVQLNLITLEGPGADMVNDFEVITTVPKRESYERTSFNVVSGSDIGSSPSTWADQGYEIDATGYDFVNVWWDLTANDSTGNQLRVACRPVTGGTNHFLPSEGDYLLDLGDADSAQVNPFYVGDAYPYIIIQTRAASLGVTPAKITIYVTFGNTLEY